MIRVVHFPKAIVAGAAGALAWELIFRLLALAGWRLVDMVRLLGTLVVPDGPPWQWWLAGLAIHLGVGALGAVFYAYFFWSLIERRPAVQGAIFGLIGAVVVELVVYPLLLLMHAPVPLLPVELWDLLEDISWRERVGLLLGHLLYGKVLGALYTRPVGRPVGQQPKPQPRDVGGRRRLSRTVEPCGPAAFMFATGIECSYPTLHDGRWRLDQMEATGHYRHWRTDLDLAAELGVTHLRYGPPLHLVYQARGLYDWSIPDAVLPAMRDIGLTPIVDLCHFGLPTWLENFQNPAVPDALRDYAAAFAARYPWVRFYTPVNEMFVCAKLSALEGLWNEQRKDERSFVTAVRHLARANVLMCQAILRERPDAVLVNGESGEFQQACCPDPEIVRKADFENERRFLPLDLLFANPVSESMRQHLFDHGMPHDEYAWFMNQRVPKRSILGVEYYDWNEKLVDADGEARSLGELFGWFVIAKQYYDRYRRPMMHTETNSLDAREAPHWLWRQWHNLQLIQKAGVPVVGFTWYSLTDQVDWDIAQAAPLGNVNPVGLFDLNRDVRPAGQAYKHLIRTFRDEPHFRECPSLKEILA